MRTGFSIDNDDLNRLEDWAADHAEDSQYWGMTYEQGVRDTIDCLRSTTDVMSGGDAVDNLIGG